MVKVGKTEKENHCVFGGSEGLTKIVKGVIKIGFILAVIGAVIAVVELAVMPGAAELDEEAYPPAGISTGCPCSGAGSVPTATPTPAPQVVDQSISTDDQQTSCPCSSGGNTKQPSPPETPATAVISAGDQQAEAGDGPVSTAEQPASSVPAEESTVSEQKAINFPSFLSSHYGGIGKFSPVKFKSFTPSWLKTGETADEMLFDSQGTNLISQFESPLFRFTGTELKIGRW